jgi:hypoxanthine phosphoribosyltransferase
MALKIGNKIYLSWDDISILVEDLCDTIASSGAQVTSITGIKRGGLIPAVMISHKLNIPYVDRINKDTLVVDDICDTGETLKKSIAMYTATLHYKPTAIFTPDFYSKEVGTEWIVYPWERSDSESIQDYLKKQL